MKKGDHAELRMKKVLRIGGSLEEKIHMCEVLRLDEKEECLYLIMSEGELPELSLDSIYECKVNSQFSQTKCTGRVRERYQGPWGKTIRFQIENGFYKINIKSVDKQIV